MHNNAYLYKYTYTYTYKSYLIITYTTNIVTTNLIKKQHTYVCMHVNNIYVYMYYDTTHTI